MSETGNVELRRLRGELVHAFLSAAHYTEFQIGLLGDLSRVTSEHVELLLNAKLEEMKAVEYVIKNPPPIKSLDEDLEKKE